MYAMQLLHIFKKFNVVRGILGSRWVGLKWFAKFVDDPIFWRAAKNAIVLSVYGIIFGMPAPIILAILLNELRSVRYKRLVQSVTYLPHFISMVIIVGMIINFIGADGIINKMIEMLGGERIIFLQDPRWFRPIYIISGIWQQMGWGSIIYLAAMTNINPELYEAATIDGAGRLRKMWHITLPGISPTISILLILNVGRLLEVGFQKVLLLYSPPVYETADVIQTYVYRRGLLGAEFSYATAVGLFQSVVGLVLVVTANRITKTLSETALW